MSSILRVKENLTNAYAGAEFAGFWPTGNFSLEDSMKEDFPYLREDDTLAFPDIVTSAAERSKWQSTTHLARLFAISRAWYLLPDGEEKDRIFDRILLPLLDHWLKHDFQSPNWWFNEICIPTQFGEIGLFIFDKLDEKRREKYLEIFGRGCFGVRPNLMKNWTGANLLWFSFSSILYAALTKDDALLRLTVDRAAEEIAFGREGMQKDGSFFQHGPRLYSCGYGISFVYTLSKEIFALSGTEFQFSEEKLSLFLFHLLDGVQYMFQGQGVDYCTVGREYSRSQNSTCKNVTLAKSLSLLTQVDELPRKAEVDAFFAAYHKNESAVSGIRVFENAMFMTSHIDGVYISVRGMNPDLWDEEICNNEGILGYNLSYGTHTTVMKTGDEYLDMSALWDYAKMPGTTTRYETDEELLAHPDFTRRPVSGKTFNCKEIDGCGFIVMDFERETVTGKFAALATPYGTVLLGTDFKDSEGAVLHTTVEQCRVCGDVALSDDKKAVLHNGVRYEMLWGENLSYTVEEKRGHYKRNNKSEKDTELKGDVLTVALDRVDNAYAYVICQEKCKGLFAIDEFSDEKAIVRIPDGIVAVISFSDGKCSLESTVM